MTRSTHFNLNPDKCNQALPYYPFMVNYYQFMVNSPTLNGWSGISGQFGLCSLMSSFVI